MTEATVTTVAGKPADGGLAHEIRRVTDSLEMWAAIIGGTLRAAKWVTRKIRRDHAA